MRTVRTPIAWAMLVAGFCGGIFTMAGYTLDRGPYCPLTGDSEEDMLYLPPGTHPEGSEWWITAQTTDNDGHECVAWTARRPNR